MKIKTLAVTAPLAALLLFGSTGMALADGRGRDRGDGYRHPSRPVVVYHARPRAVHRQPKMAYGRIIPVYHPPAYVYHRPVIVERAPVCAPVRAGWGFSIRFGW